MEKLLADAFRLFGISTNIKALNDVLYMLTTVFFVEFGSLTTSQLMEKVRGLQNLAFQLGLDEGKFLT